MSRKATITQKEIVNAAFKITKKEGFESITSRKLAAATGCSTQPIFRVYETMDELKKDVYAKTAEFYSEYYAQKYPHLFKLLFISGQGSDGKSMYDLVNGTDENVVKEINRATAAGAKNAQQLFMQMWIFIHGAGCMAVTGDYDLDEATSVNMLESVYRSFAQ